MTRLNTLTQKIRLLLMSAKVIIRCCSMWFSSQCWSGQLRNFLTFISLDGAMVLSPLYSLPGDRSTACLLHYQSRSRESPLLIGIAGIILVLLVLLLLPDRPGSDSITMALIHGPFVMLSLLGIIFCGGHWRESSVRLALHTLRW